jgi:hypothetical protein
VAGNRQSASRWPYRPTGAHADNTAAAITFVRGGPSEVDVDHVVALSDAWQKGAQQPGSVDAYNAYRQFAIEFIEARNRRIDAAEAAGGAPQARLHA